jgi:putative ABC transport system ATP-binding protein
MIIVNDVYKEYMMGKFKVQAVRGISLKIKEGSFNFVVGPSGSGKTTLLDMMGALSRPTRGEILINKTPLSKLSDYQLSIFRRRKMGYIFQSFNLIPSLTSMENVLIPLQPDGIRPEDEKKAKELLEMVGLGHRLNHKPNELSGGEKQRVAVARAFINDPITILADEPTGNLDSKTGAQVFEYLRKLNKEKGTTVVIVTHDTEFIKKSDGLFRIKDGQCNTCTVDKI